MADKQKIIGELLNRRDEQDARWGGVEHDDLHDEMDWELYIQKQLHDAARSDNSDAWRDRMVDVGALAIAALEWADRKGAEQE